MEEMIFSQTAARLGIDNNPLADQLANLRGLCNFLEVVREKARNPIFVTSGFRSKKLNDALNGSRSSAHMDGRAADIVSPFGTPKELAELIVALDLDFDQVILEFPESPSGGWVHVAVSEKPRHQVLTATRSESGVVHYDVGLA